MADVDITFGAKIDQLTAGVATVKTQLSGLSSGVGNLTSGFNQINNSVSGVMGTFGRLGSVAALATSTLAAFGLDEFARNMAEKGVAMDRLKSSLGVTSEQLLTLKSAAELSGVEVESLAMTIQRMSLIIQRSSRDALGPQAQALRILGLSAKDFVGISADQYFLKIADAASKLKPSMERSIALQDIGGRSMIKMVGAFSKGAEEIKKFTEEMKVTKTGTEGFGEASETTHRNLILMDSATSSLSKQIFTQLSPALNTIIKQSTEFANGIRENIKAGGAWGLALDGVIFALKSIMTLLAGITAMFRFLGAEGKALWRAFSEEGEDAAKDIAKNLKAELEEMTNNLKNTLEEFWGKKPITVTPKPTDLLPAGEIDQLARKRLEMAMKTADGEIAILQDAFDRKQILYERDVMGLQITEAEKIKLVAAASAQKNAEEITWIQRKLSLYGLDIAAEAELQQKIKELREKGLTDTLKRGNEYIKEVQSQWVGIFSTIQSAWDSQLQGLLTGTTSWAQAMRNIFLNLTTAIISEFEKVAIKIAAIKLQESFPSFSPAGIIPGLLGGGGGPQAAATTANTTALTALNAQLSALLTALGINIVATEESAAVTSADTVATFSNTIATVADTAATEFLATVEAIKGFFGLEAGAWNTSNPTISFPSYDSGSFRTKGGLALLHPDEMVIPKGPAQAIRDGASLGGGGHTVNIHINAMDAGSFHGALKGGLGDAITRHVSRALQSNPSMRPGYTT